EKREVHRADPFLDDIEEDERERQQRDEHGERAEDLRNARDDAATERGHDVTFRTSRRERKLMAMVMMKSSSPISISACRYNSSAASVNSLAITAAIVYCGL